MPERRSEKNKTTNVSQESQIRKFLEEELFPSLDEPDNINRITTCMSLLNSFNQTHREESVLDFSDVIDFVEARIYHEYDPEDMNPLLLSKSLRILKSTVDFYDLKG